jgi:hypothetical protein
MRELTPQTASRQTTDTDVNMSAPAVLTDLLDDNPKRHGYLPPAAQVVSLALPPSDVAADDIWERYFAERFLIEEYINGFVG